MFRTSAPRRRVRRVALASLLGFASVAAVAGPASASRPQTCLPNCPPIVGSAYGQVFWTGAGFVIEDTYNSQGQTNTVSNPAVGQFLVNLPGLTAGGGTVDVSGMSDNCTVYSWGASQASGTTIDVRCFNETGDAFDAPFLFSYTSQRQNNYPYAYALVDDKSSPTSTPDLAYQFDQGSTITVKHTDTGLYTVSFPFSGYGPGGTAKITTYGSNAWCAAVALNGTSATERVKVKCVGVNGHKADSQFTITFMRESDLLDQKTLGSGYALIIPPANLGPFAPQGNYYSWESGGQPVEAYKAQDGISFVHFAGLTTLGNAQVTAVTKTTNRCRVGDLSENAGTLTVEVVCSKMSAAPQFVDTPFMVQVTTIS